MQVAGYSVREASEITASAIFSHKPESRTQVEEIISEMHGYGDAKTVAVQYLRQMFAAESSESREDFAAYITLSKALNSQLRRIGKERGIL